MNLAKSLVVRLDQPSEQPGNIHVVYLRNAEAVRLAQVLRGVLSGDAAGGGAGGRRRAGACAAARRRRAGVRRHAGAPARRRRPGRRHRRELAATAPSGGSPGSREPRFHAGGAIIEADPSTNSLIITAPEPIYRNLRAVIDQLDARRAQVFVEALIVEVTAEQGGRVRRPVAVPERLDGNDSRSSAAPTCTPRGSRARTSSTPRRTRWRAGRRPEPRRGRRAPITGQRHRRS